MVNWKQAEIVLPHGREQKEFHPKIASPDVAKSGPSGRTFTIYELKLYANPGKFLRKILVGTPVTFLPNIYSPGGRDCRPQIY